MDRRQQKMFVAGVKARITPDVVMISRIAARSRWQWQVSLELYLRLVVVLFAYEWADFVSVRQAKRMADWAANVEVPKRYRKDGDV